MTWPMEMTREEEIKADRVRVATGCGGPSSRACVRTRTWKGLCFCLDAATGPLCHMVRTDAELKAEFVRELLEEPHA